MVIKEPSLNQIEILKNGLINKINNFGKHNGVYTLRDGNINYILLYCNEGLKLYGNTGYYSKCFLTIKPNKIFKKLKEVLK